MSVNGARNGWDGFDLAGAYEAKDLPAMRSATEEDARQALSQGTTKDLGFWRVVEFLAGEADDGLFATVKDPRDDGEWAHTVDAYLKVMSDARQAWEAVVERGVDAVRAYRDGLMLADQIDSAREEGKKAFMAGLETIARGVERRTADKENEEANRHNIQCLRDSGVLPVRFPKLSTFNCRSSETLVCAKNVNGGSVLIRVEIARVKGRAPTARLVVDCATTTGLPSASINVTGDQGDSVLDVVDSLKTKCVQMGVCD